MIARRASYGHFRVWAAARRLQSATAIKSNQQALRKEREGEAKENGHELPQGA